ncbi:MAG TPA: MoxR family ATPase, partial [Thermoprotei archaeon]|nr:MoxR family ATPase [Thermoprotei archaeon]
MSGMDLDSAYDVINGIRENISRVVVGKDFEVKIILATLFSEGHVLIEGPPGIAKTLLSKSIAKSIEGVFKRIQGNPDILPSDITGFHVYSLNGSTRFVRGPIFANIVFFDELNRTPTRSQAALLEAMQEYQVTVDGVTYRLDKPFMVIATQLPTELGPGTFPLTPTLVDRFTVKIETGYSSPNEEYEIVTKSDYLDVKYIEPVTNVDTVNKLVSFIKEGIHIGERVAKYIVDLLTYIRSRDDVVAGVSHRASISLYRVSRVLALMDKRDYV